MGLKSISIVLFGLALCCFLQGTAADFCQLKLWYGPDLPDTYLYASGEGSFQAPFPGWYMIDTYNATNALLYHADSVEKASSYCDNCVLTVFSGETFDGTSQVVDFRFTLGNNSLITWSFNAKSYTLECYTPEHEEEEEEEEIEQPEEQEEIWEPEEQEEIPPEEEEEEETIDSSQFLDAVFQQMNEGDGETLPHWLVELRHLNVQDAIHRLVSEAILPAGTYTTERVYSTESSTNHEGLYRFNVQVRDESGVEYRIWFTVYSYPEDWEAYWLIDAGYKENRIGEFTQTEFKVLPPVEESQEPYPEEVEDLRTKSVNQALVRLQAKNILPLGNYSIFAGYDIEYSAIVNMTEYPDHDDMLYRFTVRFVDQSGALFRVWAIIATNYETPEYYELIDYGYKQSRLAEFTETDWRDMNEGEDMPLPGDIVQMRNLSVAQALPRLQAEGTLPEGQYTIAKTYATEFSFGFVNPDWTYFTSQPTDGLYRFNVQLSNEAGARFRIAVVVITNSDIQPKYELIDYSFVENTLDEFTNTKFVSLDQGDIGEKSINEAVDRLVSKDVLPEGEYTIVKNYPTQFSSKFENPDYSDDQYVLFNFTSQVNNTAGDSFKVYAVVITDYDDLADYELIDYGKI